MTTTTTDADRALKSKHRTMWALGDYSAVADEVVHGLGPVLVDASGVRTGDQVLDVAAGTGNAAIPAARRRAAWSSPATSRPSFSTSGGRTPTPKV